MKLALSSDHRGLGLLKVIASELEDMGHDVVLFAPPPALVVMAWRSNHRLVRCAHSIKPRARGALSLSVSVCLSLSVVSAGPAALKPSSGALCSLMKPS